MIFRKENGFYDKVGIVKHGKNSVHFKICLSSVKCWEKDT